VKNPLLPFRAAIEGVREEAADVRTYSLLLRDVPFDPLPGQFNMVGHPGVGEAPISLSSLPRGGAFEHTVRAVGRVTAYLAGLRKGQEMFLRGPYGSGWPIKRAEGRDLLIVAGGLGLAPLRPVLQRVMEDRGAFGSVTLIYGSRDPASLLFRDEYPEWRRHIPVLLTVDEVPRGALWEQGVGLVTDVMESVAIAPGGTLAFICGPEIMMRFAARLLLLKGLPPSSIYVSLERRMKCGVGQCGHCQHGSTFVCKDGPVYAYGDINRFPDGLL
jgi:NAD(P)H-flavin reductase